MVESSLCFVYCIPVGGVCGGFINSVGWVCCYGTVACLLLFTCCEIFVNLMLLCVRIIMVACFGLVFGLVYCYCGCEVLVGCACCWWFGYLCFGGYC